MLELTAQGMAQYTDDQSQVLYHSAIQAPQYSNYIKSRKSVYILLWKWPPLRLEPTDAHHECIEPSA